MEEKELARAGHSGRRLGMQGGAEAAGCLTLGRNHMQ